MLPEHFQNHFGVERRDFQARGNATSLECSRRRLRSHHLRCIRLRHSRCAVVDVVLLRLSRVMAGAVGN